MGLQIRLLALSIVVSSCNVTSGSFNTADTNNQVCSSNCPAIVAISTEVATPGTTIQVSGSNFQDSMILLFGSEPLDVVVTSPDLLTFVVPDREPGFYELSVPNNPSDLSSPAEGLGLIVVPGDHPVNLDVATNICDDVTYYDR